MTEKSKPQAEQRIDLKNRTLAAVLAYLLPGAGHFYQERYFKSAIYAICILMAYFTGQVLGDWKTTYAQQTGGKTYIGYYSQVLVGTPALPALLQTTRYQTPFRPQDQPFHDHQEKAERLEEQIDADFEGRIIWNNKGKKRQGTVQGRVELQPAARGLGVTGTLKGTLKELQTGKSSPIEVPLSGQVTIGPKIYALEDVTYYQIVPGNGQPLDPPRFSSTRRYLHVEIPGDGGSTAGEIEGTIPRSFVNWYQVPIENQGLQYLNGTLGKQWDLALVYTWIAGLLNLLAVWDAYEGPAYGYGDEEEEDDDSATAESKQDETKAEAEPALETKAAPVAAETKS
jgi:hypothetical protein